VVSAEAPRFAGSASGEPLTIAGPAGALEARFTTPAAAPTHCAVICHPHPLFGGTMDNKVVTTLVRAAAARGAATVRFNFRGVGASAGEHDHGVGEVDDALAVIDWAAARWPGTRLWLLGFSFGSRIALAAAVRRPVERLVCVAPPVGRMAFGESGLPACPCLVVQGDADELIDANAVIAWAQAAHPAPRLEILPGVSHFFHGRLHDLSAVVGTFLD
jgi:alpha/beta superfamily hydrolase